MNMGGPLLYVRHFVPPYLNWVFLVERFVPSLLS